MTESPSSRLYGPGGATPPAPGREPPVPQLLNSIRTVVQPHLGDVASLLREFSALQPLHERQSTLLTGRIPEVEADALDALVTSLRLFGCVVLSGSRALVSRAPEWSAWVTFVCAPGTDTFVFEAARTAGAHVERTGESVASVLIERGSDPMSAAAGIESAALDWREERRKLIRSQERSRSATPAK